MNLVPLLGHASLDDIFAWRPDGPLTVRDFLADAAALADYLPPGRHLLNVCQDRYRFAVGLAAGLLSGRTSLQPSSQSAATLRQIAADCPDVCCLCDSDFASLDLPRLDFPELALPRGDFLRREASPLAGRGAVDPQKVAKIPAIAADHPAIQVYTSGSTGQPVPYRKSWGSLVRNAQTEARRLGAAGHAIVGTVPAQHMYGFESTVLLAMHGNAPFWSGKPFYPQDIVAALAAVPQPRLLVTTPFHLAALLAANLELPAIDLLLSATAPLSEQLAAAAEARFAAPLVEIYGCTESGQIASRRTTAGPAWQLLDGVRLEREDGRTFACGGHVEGREALSDIIEILADGRFLLHGRDADLVNIAGRRTSLAYLNHQLTAVVGVRDGAFFLPDKGAADAITRLCAFAVAPGLSVKQLMKALRERIDPVFLPRPLVLLDALPRNSTGKLPRERLQALYAEQMQHAGR
jgi:acyl-coenzyme A synthetase/AMP-(fatty) acid ligase